MKNKYCYYTSSCILRNTLSCTKKCLLSLYIVSYNKKYTFIYERNVCCYYISSYIIINKYYYTLSRIMRNTLSCMIEMFVVIIYSLI